MSGWCENRFGHRGFGSKENEYSGDGMSHAAPG